MTLTRLNLGALSSQWSSSTFCSFNTSSNFQSNWQLTFNEYRNLQVYLLSFASFPPIYYMKWMDFRRFCTTNHAFPFDDKFKFKSLSNCIPLNYELSI